MCISTFYCIENCLTEKNYQTAKGKFNIWAGKCVAEQANVLFKFENNFFCLILINCIIQFRVGLFITTEFQKFVIGHGISFKYICPISFLFGSELLFFYW